jgi:hypothetical protein
MMCCLCGLFTVITGDGNNDFIAGSSLMFIGAGLFLLANRQKEPKLTPEQMQQLAKDLDDLPSDEEALFLTGLHKKMEREMKAQHPFEKMRVGELELDCVVLRRGTFFDAVCCQDRVSLRDKNGVMYDVLTDLCDELNYYDAAQSRKLYGESTADTTNVRVEAMLPDNEPEIPGPWDDHVSPR